MRRIAPVLGIYTALNTAVGTITPRPMVFSFLPRYTGPVITYTSCFCFVTIARVASSISLARFVGYSAGQL